MNLKLSKPYETWTGIYHLGKHLIVDVDNLKFPEGRDGLNSIISKIDAKTHGLF